MIPTAVHPRAGGERASPSSVSGFQFGSSPRGRGTADEALRDPAGLRFIPARAGNGNSRPTCPSSRPVHPRAGGERQAEQQATVKESGSSPRGRGTGKIGDGCQRVRRFIPARAGNGMAIWVSQSKPAVHPRAGGERCSIAICAAGIRGSSPRGRGTAAALLPGRLLSAVHPRAGGERPRCSGARQPAAGSSPRGRGTDDEESGSAARTVGSSPRGRGTALDLHHSTRCIRFIPARAGNGLTMSLPPFVPFGSSPRGRGTGNVGRCLAVVGRFIPARAGNGLPASN